MNIAQVAPLYEAVPPRLYGGTERIVYFLTEALIELGHQVTLFTSADAKTRAELVSVRDQAIRLDPVRFKSDLAAHLTMMSELRKPQDRFDLIHFHTDAAVSTAFCFRNQRRTLTGAKNPVTLL